ncbi:hypothetical protein H9Y04_12175 [Streptomyces sp. TRM66268-LWL]|uniref:Integral membrane protein n=1 Tax=Streptomyces polyasparticus TaxID=2767826 RepID=A0ABR7SCW0_9ACTN|nr:hypothetical protein [Streptomyces polyasparticus]MBC9713326.1 hypothetical protein [Streptomyces polyasparticus]
MKGRLGGLVRLTVTNPLSLAYLGLIAACALAGALYEWTVADPDSMLKGVGYSAALLPLLPTLLLYIPLEDLVYDGPAPTGWLFYVWAAVSFLVQSAAMGWLWRGRE